MVFCGLLRSTLSGVGLWYDAVRVIICDEVIELSGKGLLDGSIEGREYVSTGVGGGIFLFPFLSCLMVYLEYSIL